MTAPLADRIRAVLALAEKATPGPWSVEPRHHAQNQVVETDCLKTVDIGPETFRGRSIATVWKPGDHGWQDARPNAAFIAAAPEMAALLRECLADDGWRPIETYADEHPIQIRAPELVDEFNEAGETDACALCGDEWYAAQWCNCQDFFKTIRVNPTHFRPLPAPPGAEL